MTEDADVTKIIEGLLRDAEDSHSLLLAELRRGLRRVSACTSKLYIKPFVNHNKEQQKSIFDMIDVA